MLKLNLGCGSNKIEGCVNIDIEESCKPDIIADFRTYLPYDNDTADCIYLFHVIEHIEEFHHQRILDEIWRVLKPEGKVLISFPEFRRCAMNYIENYKGKKDFWKKTIFGRQLYKSDYHVALMDTLEFKPKLIQCGFKSIESAPEPQEPYNTVIKAVKGEKPKYYEDLVISKIFDSTELR